MQLQQDTACWHLSQERNRPSLFRLTHSPALSLDHSCQEKNEFFSGPYREFRLLVIPLSHGRPSESSEGAAGSPDTRPAASPALSRHVPLQWHPEERTELGLTLGLLEVVKAAC